MRLTELDYMHDTSMEIFHQSTLFSTHPPKKKGVEKEICSTNSKWIPWKRNYIQYKILATICPPNRIVWTLETF
jgi:hypothetical protein